MTERLLTVHDVAKLTRFSAEAVRRAVRRGEVRASKMCGEYRFAADDVDAWFRGSEVGSTPEPVERPAARKSLPRAPAGSSVRERMKQNRQPR